MPWSYIPGNPVVITPASSSGPKLEREAGDAHNMKRFAHQRPLGVAAASLAALLLAGCGSGSGSAGTVSSTAVPAGDSTGTA